MARLQWDQEGSRLYETGTDRGVLYVMNSSGAYQTGVPWNGLTQVSESPSGAEESAQYADNIKYLALRSEEEYGATIEAFTYPDEFSECDGSREPVEGVLLGQQSRRKFGFCYRTIVGNDTSMNDYGYKLHIVYGCTASPSEKSYQTINDSPEAISLSWEVTATKVAVEGFKPVASLTIDSTKVSAELLEALEKILYGDEANEPRLPMPAEVISLMTPSTP